MRRYLLDTNILSAVIKNPQGMAAARILAKTPEIIFTSIVVAAEMRFGVAKKNAEVLAARVDALLEHITVGALDRDADRHYGRIRTALEREAKLIGGNDLSIAAHALALNAVLVTANVAEFKRVKGLKLENWLVAWMPSRSCARGLRIRTEGLTPSA